MRLHDYAPRPAHIKWLLDSDPAIRWQVMRDLTGDAPEAIAAERSRVATEGWGAHCSPANFLPGTGAVRSGTLLPFTVSRSPPVLPIQQTEKTYTCSGPFSRLVYHSRQPTLNAIAWKRRPNLDMPGFAEFTAFRLPSFRASSACWSQ
jgi:hypothetical protein